jgi:polysaccharide deacetylase 2 family uncharacterized protein YibQ
MAVEDAPVPAPDSSEDAERSNVPKRTRSTRALVIAYAVAFALLGGAAGALNFLGDPADGSPSVTIRMLPFPTVAEAATMRVHNVFHDAREIQGRLVADPALIEDSPQGPLPKIGPDGRTAMKAYGRSFDKASKRPKIAVVLRGLGVGADETEQALSQLSPDITFGFVPFTPDLQDEVDKARGAGHEVLLEAPMEPFDFPDSDPGPHVLLVAASPDENGKRLEWVLSRATGYVGLMNLLGGRFMGEESAIEPVLSQVAKRGLLFFDDGASSNSVAITSARHVKAWLASGMVTLDAVQTPAAVDSKLAELENAARQDGFAIGVASAYPVSIARLNEWAANARARGFEIVPVSGFAFQPGQQNVSAE